MSRAIAADASSAWARSAAARRWTTLLTYLLLLVLTALFMGPFLFAFLTSFKAPNEIFVFPPRFFPEAWRVQNYRDAWTQAPFSLFFRNTVLITLLAMLGQIGSASLVAYGFARFRFPGRDALFLLVISTLILPEEVTIIPTFIAFKAIGWLDTWYPLIVPAYFGGGAFSVFLLRQFFLTLPREMDEAAEIDGAGTLRILWSIVLPLSKPALATLAIFSFLGRWNDFFHPLIYLSTTERFTISLGLRFYQQVATAGGPAREHLLMAAAFAATLPIVVIFFVFQRQFVRGIVLSGIKG
ncbi:MAG TPA: carbohydrate ABC transporter permease [Chloroflexota bacterium]|jgi:multiple sugar transport system permease protein